MTLKAVLGRSLAFAFLTAALPAWAQRADENVLASAQDAFGTTVGNESIGLYTARDVRGFNPVEAGNIRLEGLYYDRAFPNPFEIFITSLAPSSAVRVGLSAQSYLFPAPTGIADVSLRIPKDKLITSAVVQYGAYSRASLEINSEIPVTDRFSVALGGGYVDDDDMDAGHNKHVFGAAIGRWRINDNIEVIPFYSRKNSDGISSPSNIYTAGSFLPPKIPRHVFMAQPWGKFIVRDTNFGTIVNANLAEGWTLRTGLFSSNVIQGSFNSNLFSNLRLDQTADNSLVRFPRQTFDSYSGEVRLTRVITAGSWRHTFNAALRGRSVERNFGGSQTVNLGRVVMGQNRVVPEPPFTPQPLSLDTVRQGTGGLSYEAIWAGVGEGSLGLQKTSYRRTLTLPGGTPTINAESPWLPNVTLALHANPQFTFFGSYTRGLEESGRAPNNASNRGETLSAIKTSQVDFGVRYKLTPQITAVATAFQIKKPYQNIDTTNLYTNIGDVRHRGIEVSVAGQAAEGLRIVAGAVFLQARLFGTLVDQGRIGQVPIGRTPRALRFDVEYGPKSWQGASVDLQVDNRSSRFSSADNLVRIPQRTMFNLGGRYRFKAFDHSASLRLQVRNVFDTFAWDIKLMQLSYITEEQRRYLATLAVDF